MGTELISDYAMSGSRLLPDGSYNVPPSSSYIFCVIVKDAANNKVCYPNVTVNFLASGTIGNGTTLTFVGDVIAPSGSNVIFDVGKLTDIIIYNGSLFAGPLVTLKLTNGKEMTVGEGTTYELKSRTQTSLLLDPNGGMGSPTPVTGFVGGLTYLPTGVFVNPGFTFLGWNTLRLVVVG